MDTKSWYSLVQDTSFFFFDGSSGSVSFAIPQHPSDCKLFLDTAGKLNGGNGIRKGSHFAVPEGLVLNSHADRECCEFFCRCFCFSRPFGLLGIFCPVFYDFSVGAVPRVHDFVFPVKHQNGNYMTSSRIRVYSCSRRKHVVNQAAKLLAGQGSFRFASWHRISQTPLFSKGHRCFFPH